MTDPTRLRVFWRLLEGVVLAVFVGMLVLVGAQIAFRYVLKLSVPWTEEAARWLYVWQIFLGSALAMRHGMHLRATFLYERLPVRLRAILDVVAWAATLVFFGGVLWGGLVMMRTVYPVQAASFSVSTSFLYLALPLSLALMIGLGIRELAAALRALTRPDPRALDG